MFNGRREPAAEVSSAQELEHVLDGIATRARREYPLIVFVDCHGYRVGRGLGREEGFVHLEQESGSPPYMIAVGDSSAEGVVAFYLLGNHHTEIPRRNLVPVAEAREVLCEWIEKAALPEGVKWEEV